MQSGMLLPVFGGTYYLCLRRMKMEATGSSETVTIYQTAVHHIPEETVILKFTVVRTPDLSHLATIQNELRCNVNHCICCTVFCGMILCEQALVQCLYFEHLYVLWNIVIDNDTYDIFL